MKLFCMLVLGISLIGCTSNIVYRQAPTEKLATAQLVRSTGTVSPWQLSFTALSHFDGEAVRLVVLSELGVKLLDAQVTPSQTEVYYKVSQLPAVAVQAFSRFARTSLAANCPPGEIYYKDAQTRAEFHVEAVCP